MLRQKINIGDQLWRLNADKSQISQVITNLIINAKQAMPKGGKLTIEAYNCDNYKNNVCPWLTGNIVCLKVTDEGIGISQDLKAHIFDPYFTTKPGGSGLGLATVYSIIKKHNGFVEVESTVGKGTSFSLYLPANTERENEKYQPFLSPALFSTKTPSNILLMDDEAMILDVAKEMLESLGYKVDTVINSKQAIKKYKQSSVSSKPYDAVIMDLTIPGGKGGEYVIKELLLFNPEIKAIVTSGYSTGKVMSYPQKYGFKERLIKPFNMDTLEETLNKVLTE
jgi:CheY-like chemotaxis protein